MKLFWGIKKLVWSWVLQRGSRGSCNQSVYLLHLCLICLQEYLTLFNFQMKKTVNPGDYKALIYHLALVVEGGTIFHIYFLEFRLSFCHLVKLSPVKTVGPTDFIFPTVLTMRKLMWQQAYCDSKASLKFLTKIEISNNMILKGKTLDSKVHI